MTTRAAFVSSLGATGLAVGVPQFTATSTIGVVLPLSGDARRAGEAVLNGVRAAVEDANARRNPLDRAFTFTTYDDHNVAAEATVQSGFACNDGNVVAVIGHLSATATLAALPTYVGAQMPVIVPASTDDRLTARRSGNVFRLPPRDHTEGELIARAVTRERKPAKPVILVQDGDYGADVATGLIAGFKAAGLNAQYLQYSWNDPDTAKVVSHVQALAADHVSLAGTARDMGSTLVALRSAGYAGRIAAAQGFFDALTVTTYAKAADGMLVASSMPYLPLAPQTSQVQRDFETRYGEAFSLLPASGYAAAQLAMTAVKRAGIPNRIGVLRALQVPQPVDTVLGPLLFGIDGDQVDPNLYLYAVDAGKFKYVRQAKPGGYLLR